MWSYRGGALPSHNLSYRYVLHQDVDKHGSQASSQEKKILKNQLILWLNKEENTRRGSTEYRFWVITLFPEQRASVVFWHGIVWFIKVGNRTYLSFTIENGLKTLPSKFQNHRFGWLLLKVLQKCHPEHGTSHMSLICQEWMYDYNTSGVKLLLESKVNINTHLHITLSMLKDLKFPTA